MVKQILLIHYSQSGQGKAIAENILSGFPSEETMVDQYPLQPNPPYPFPWTSDRFFDAMPESVEGIPCHLEIPEGNFDKHYDLILFVYPVWYLSPAIPAAAFLQSAQARKLMSGKPVVTISGLRNMGVAALNDVKKYLSEIGAQHAGNIALRDTHNNLVSVLTIIRWLMKGQKEASKNLPEAGVKQKDIAAASRFGKLISEALKEQDLQNLNEDLIKTGANDLDYAVMNMELKAKRIFGIWSQLILKKGSAGDSRRIKRVRLFKYYLLAVIFVVSPIAGFIFNIQKFIMPQRAKASVYKRQQTANVQKAK